MDAMTGYRNEPDPFKASEAAYLLCPHCSGIITAEKKICVTTWTHSFLYRRTASERSVEALFRMLAGLIFGHLHNEKFMRVPKGAGNSVPWDPELTPYIIEPMNCLASREYDAVIFVGPARTGKTIGLIDVVGKILPICPFPNFGLMKNPLFLLETLSFLIRN